MMDMYEQATIDHLRERIDRLRPGLKPLWGKMTVEQMLAHMRVSTNYAISEEPVRRGFMARLLGGYFLKQRTKNAKLTPKNLPTHPDFKIKHAPVFEEEKRLLLAYLDEHAQRERQSFENRIHPFFGKMSAKECSVLDFKHFDHHLRQFGV